jgi:ribosomal protein L11 methyltransferase
MRTFPSPQPSPSGRESVVGRALKNGVFPARHSLWKVSIRTSPEAEEAVTELLGHAFKEPVSSYTDVRTLRTTVTVYLEKRPAWPGVKRAAILAGLQLLRNASLSVGSGNISLERVRQEYWADSWKRHFKPIEIGSALLIRPSWSRRYARKGQAVVEIDPGLSFGTGQHPTTAFCLEQLVARRRHGEPQSFLDLGTGSGILAIAAAKLGYGPIAALDSDPAAIRIARANARQNGVARRIGFLQQDVRKIALRGGRQFGLVCANLISDLLVNERARILARTQTGGVLIVAGILEREFAGVQKAYKAAGLRLISSRREREWRSGAFKLVILLRQKNYGGQVVDS